MQKKVLIVDDSPMIRHVVSQIVKDSGFRVLVAKDGKEGYDMAKGQHPDLVIMDVEMPVMDGIEATTLITSDPDTAHIPVMIFTSLGCEDDLQRAQAAGCRRILNKPISRETLRAALEEILGGP
ncbi:MAG: response regulator [Deltaproteobacteria bacterium]|nr:response regulator [Deltaproteobacteria bacterium]